jgi:hypothetical protein
MTLKKHLTEVLHYMRDVQLTIADRLPAADRDAAGTLDRWSIKDTLAHNMEWLNRHIADLEAVARGEAWPDHDYGDYEDVNRAIFEAHQHESWAVVQDMIRAAYARVDAYLARTDEDTLRRIPDEETQPLWQIVAGSGSEHPMLHLWEHLQQHGHDALVIELFGRAFADRLLALSDAAQWQGTVYYDLACVYTLAGETAPALDALAHALRLHPDLKDWAQEDAHLTPLHTALGFKALFD